MTASGLVFERHHTSLVDQARDLGARLYFPQRLEPLDAPEALDMKLSAVKLSGGVMLGRMRYGIDVRIDCGDLSRAYEVNIPLSGSVRNVCGSQHSVSTPSMAAVFNPIGHTRLDRWSGDCTLLGLKIERKALDDAFRALAGHAPDRPIAFPLDLPLTSPGARRWLRTIDLLCDELDEPGGVPGQDRFQRELATVITTGLLLVHRHDQMDALRTSPGPLRPGLVHRATRVVEDDPARAWTVPGLAEEVGVPVRTLQHAFHRYVGESPTVYLRNVRLDRTREYLAHADGTATTVAAVAHRFGFGHLGRFSSAYQERFGELPSATLRS